jgi:uncharacterized protein YdaL
VLYDTSGPWGYLGELYAIQVANLGSHFGSWTAKPVTGYLAGDADAAAALIYVGSSYGEPLPDAFLGDVLTGKAPVLWLEENVWQLLDHDPFFSERYGWAPGQRDFSAIRGVRYKGIDLPRDPANQPHGLIGCWLVERDRVSVLADAVRDDGATLPWAVRSGNLTYVGEIPFRFSGEADRQLVLADLLFDLLAPATPERHRALVRLEDIGPDADPERLRAVGTYLREHRIPFSFGIYPVCAAPHAEPVRLADRPEVVLAIRRLIADGGTMVLHGYTHQYGTLPNPYDARSGSDFEFFRAGLDADNRVQLLGPVPEDSKSWALGRLEAATRELRGAGLPAPSIFEFPHYAGSPLAYQAVATRFEARYDRGLYFTGLLQGGQPDTTKMVGQMFPYSVRDVYGSNVIPENLGSYAPTAFHANPTHRAADIVEAGRRELVVRDGVASFFYHPSLGLEPLPQIIAGLQEAGYTFVRPQSLECPPAP